MGLKYGFLKGFIDFEPLVHLIKGVWLKAYFSIIFFPISSPSPRATCAGSCAGTCAGLVRALVAVPGHPRGKLDFFAGLENL